MCIKYKYTLNVLDEASRTPVVKEQSQVATPTPTGDTQSPGDQAHQIQHSSAGKIGDNDIFNTH